MKPCDMCQQQEACVEVKHVAHGVLRELSLCLACAAAKGVQMPENLSALLLEEQAMPPIEQVPVLPDSDDVATERVQSCPNCHMKLGEFRRTGRVGCPTCFEVWHELLDSMLLGMHRSLHYAGSAPQKTMPDHVHLRQELEKAVAREDYEKAAVLRDRLRKQAQPVATQGDLRFDANIG